MTDQVDSDTPVEPDRIVIRPLTASDSGAYRALRQHILEIGEGKFFSSSYTREQQLTTEAAWGAWCSETALRCIIGSFVDGALVGIMAIQPCGDPRHRTAEWDSTWIAPAYRTSGVARQSYEHVRAWSLEHGYRYVIVDVRADNTRSLQIREKQGAIYLCTQRDVTWADGSTADTHYLMMSIVPEAERARSTAQAVGLLEAGLAFLRHEPHEA
jgi:RimJ/RimL family protein N-acetyltransferase